MFFGALWEVRAMTDIVPGDRHGPRNVVVIGWLVLLAGIGRLLMAARRGQCRPPYGWLFWMVRTRRGWGGLGRWYRGTVMTVPYIIDLLDNGGGGSVLHWVVVMAGRRGQCRPPYGWLFWMVRTRRGWGGFATYNRGTARRPFPTIYEQAFRIFAKGLWIYS